MTNADNSIIEDILDMAAARGDSELEALCYRALGESDPDNVLPSRDLAILVIGGVEIDDAAIEVLDFASDLRASRVF